MKSSRNKVASERQSNRNDQMHSQSKRFQEACEVMRQNAAKFLENELSSDSSSEDEIDDLQIMKKTFSNYTDESSNLRKISEFLQDTLTSRAVVCLICIESVKRNDKIWSCQNCYCMLHLECIQKWAKDSLYHLSSNLDEKKKNSLKWCCPKCRYDYEPMKQFKYFCFCGKVENPVYDSWNIPHSCGKTCDKKLKPECGHTCCLLCHPGPCPPCPKTVLVTCCCAKSEKVSRRCSSQEWFCGKLCKRLLSCQIHYCEIPCHKGPCPPCNRQSKQKCLCGLCISVRPCHDAKWQCEKVCAKLLNCKEHYCEIICHEGPCPGCPNSGPRSCPCGKELVVLPCTESVPLCGDTCNKLLECELHRCSERCHYGPCEKCLQMRMMKCRCSLREKSVPCCKEFLCDIKCKKRRDCGRHNCNRKCCIGNCPPCEVPCGRTLNCGRHKCTSICHPGPCYPCREVVDVTCNCGATKISVPCGRKKSAVPPRCVSDCKRPSDCHHSERQKHKCHFGSCPPCRLICEKTLNCGHICSFKCHSAVLTKIETKQKKEGPWDLRNSYRMELVCKPCPPCSVPLPIRCLGGHEIQDIPCSSAVSTSCGRKCGRLLSCGNHTCSLECHSVDDMDELTKASSKCETCNELCQKPKKPGCIHPCSFPCHPGKCKPCKQHIRLKCHCQINTLYIACEEWTSANEDKKAELMSCSNRCPKEIICGHRCILLCHSGSCSDQNQCKKKVLLRCPCKRKKTEVQCFNLIEKNISCDDDCLKHQESQIALEYEKISKKEEEEKKIQEREYEEFLKKTRGKKKKKRKNSENEQGYNKSSLIKLGSIAAVLCIIGSLISYFYTELQ
ncbi:NF-X1-type zinc finger protein NFXL1 [Nephila pilipes]|uniref:NF-X1-type zinc finger protein NFXL1 n=1 Tax=Nephila pilipes TaxID=299642 RepID=A0A8X6PEF6_NEPPI|nr:NF-X1-type zinc finger protein NFXL1 [Nephila pilipes]